MSIGVEAEEGLCCFDGFIFVFVSAVTHLAFTVAAHSVGVNGEDVCREMAGGVTELSKGDLELLGVEYGMGV